MQRPRVYFFTGNTAHPFYVHQYACSPESVEMVPGTDELRGFGIKKDIPAMGTRRGNLRAAGRKAAVGALTIAGIPNARRIRPDADLIHSAQHVVFGGRRWILDFEDVSVLFWYGSRPLRHPVARRLVRSALAEGRCRHLLPWTEAAKRSLRTLFDDPTILEKTEVVYPAISRVAEKPRVHSDGGTVRLLFVGTRFYAKGGIEILRVFQRLRRRFPVEMTMVTVVPPDMTSALADVDGLTVVSKISSEEMAAEFERADIFVMTSHMDTFGFVFLEAFAHGIPCVSTTHFSTPEIISAGETGLLVPAENSYFGPDHLPRFAPVYSDDHDLVDRLREPSETYLASLEDAIGTLVEDTSLRAEMGSNAFEAVTTGRFSCRRRSEAMGRIYGEAVTG